MNTDILIKKLRTIYNDSTLGDIPLIIKELQEDVLDNGCEHLYRDASDTRYCVDCGKYMNKEGLINLIADELLESKKEFKEYNGEFVRNETSITEDNAEDLTVDDLIDRVDNWELDGYMDSAYQVGRIRILEWLLDKVKEVK